MTGQCESLPGADCRNQKTERNKYAAEDAGDAGRPSGIVVDATTEEHRGCSEQRQARSNTMSRAQEHKNRRGHWHGGALEHQRLRRQWVRKLLEQRFQQPRFFQALRCRHATVNCGSGRNRWNVGHHRSHFPVIFAIGIGQAWMMVMLGFERAEVVGLVGTLCKHPRPSQ